EDCVTCQASILSKEYHLPPHEFRDYYGILRRTRVQRHPCFVILRERLINDRPKIFAELAVLAIARDTDDFAPWVSRFTEAQPFAQRVLTCEVLPRERIVDDYNARRPLIVLGGEIAPPRKRDAHCLKILRADDVQSDTRQTLAAADAVIDLLFALPLEDKAASASVTADRHNTSQARRLHARNAFDALDHSPVKLAGLWFCITQQVDSERPDKNLLGAESWIRVLDPP